MTKKFLVMKDFKAISNTVKNGLKQRVFGKSSYGNIVWKEASFAWYETNRNLDVLQDFKPYFNAKRKMIKTVLEVGCGAGVYPIKEKELFNGVEYTGNDFSENNIEYCKNHSDFNFIAGDFIKMDINQKYDLVYSHGVIDHVYDIDTFLLNLVKSCKKYAYITSYRGYFPDLDEHKMNWRDEDGCYYSDISIKQIENLLLKNGFNKNQVTFRCIKNIQKHYPAIPKDVPPNSPRLAVESAAAPDGLPIPHETQLVIEIDKTA